MNKNQPYKSISWDESLHRIKVATRGTIIKPNVINEIIEDLKRKPELTLEERELLRNLEEPVSLADWKPIVFNPPDKFTILDKSGSEPNYKRGN